MKTGLIVKIKAIVIELNDENDAIGISRKMCWMYDFLKMNIMISLISLVKENQGDFEVYRILKWTK